MTTKTTTERSESEDEERVLDRLVRLFSPVELDATEALERAETTVRELSELKRKAVT